MRGASAASAAIEPGRGIRTADGMAARIFLREDYWKIRRMCVVYVDLNYCQP